jgi:nucleoid-associated protein YgaU
MFLEAIATRRVRLLAAGISPKKAKIRNLEKPFLDPRGTIEVSFNPASIKYTCSPQYDSSKVPSSEAGYRMFYTGNVAPTLDMDLLFDTTITGDDVREKYIDFLVDLTRPVPDSDPMQTPKCMFTWGDFTRGDYLSFEAVLSNLRVNYIYFLANGRPVRAEVDVTFKAPEDIAGGTNPTSRSEARRVWTVVQGQTLDWIAYQEYGDAAAWRHIARENNIRNPRVLKPGTILRLTPLK